MRWRREIGSQYDMLACPTFEPTRTNIFREIREEDNAGMGIGDYTCRN